MSEISRDRSDGLTVTNIITPADTTATATSSAIDMKGAKRATLIIHIAGVTGGGDWTPSLTASATSGGTYTAETSANVFTAGAPAAITNALAGVKVYDLNVGQITQDKRYIKVVLTKSGTISASVLSAVLIVEKGEIA